MVYFFFFNDTATTEIYTLSLHDALPIWSPSNRERRPPASRRASGACPAIRSEEHTSELQSQSNLVCRLLLEKKKNHKKIKTYVPTLKVSRTRTPLPPTLGSAVIVLALAV